MHFLTGGVADKLVKSVRINEMTESWGEEYDDYGFGKKQGQVAQFPFFLAMDKMSPSKDSTLYKVLDYYVYRDMFSILLPGNVRNILKADSWGNNSQKQEALQKYSSVTPDLNTLKDYALNAQSIHFIKQ